MMEFTVERQMDYILFLGPKEWSNCKASVIIGDILAAFNERAEQHVQLAHIWDDMTFDYLRLDHPVRIREVLDMLAQSTGSCLVCDDTQVSFVRDEKCDEQYRRFMAELGL